MMWKSDIRMRENSNYVNLSALLIVEKCNYSVLLYTYVKASNEENKIIICSLYMCSLFIL